MIKNPSAMQKTWVPFLGWDDHLERIAASGVVRKRMIIICNSDHNFSGDYLCDNRRNYIIHSEL